MSRSNSGDSNLRRRIQRLGVLLGVVPLTFVSFCEGGAVRFTLENETNQTLYVSAFYEHCQESPGNQQDYYFHEIMVRPGQTLRYSKDSPGSAHDVKCIQATDSLRRLVLSEPYKSDGTYVVSRAAAIQGDALPPFDRLPSQPWLDRQREDFNEDPAGYIVSAVVIIGGLTFLVAGAVVALVYGMVYLIRQRRSRNESSGT